MKIDKFESEFHVSSYIIFYKFILGVFELILGLGIMIFGNQLFKLYSNFRNQELLEDPHDLIVNVLGKLLPLILEYKGYIILILIGLGLIKVIGAIGLYYKKEWGLDLLIGLTFLLLPFDLAALIRHSTTLKLMYFIINLFIALYLVNFKPQKYFISLKTRMRKR